MSQQPPIPKVFISYSHDTLGHKKWVLDLAIRLRNNGVDSIIDQWSLGPGDDLPHFMEQNLASSDRVLMICTSNYVDKANRGAGGVGYEKMIVTANLMKTIDSNKIIPIIRQDGSHLVPTFLGSKLYINFSNDDEFESALDDLLRSLHNSPLFTAPPIANNPFKPADQTPVDRTGDGVKLVMAGVIKIFESHSSEFVSYAQLLKYLQMSRIMADHYLDEAKSAGLITAVTREFFKLTAKGREYAIINQLIR